MTANICSTSSMKRNKMYFAIDLLQEQDDVGFHFYCRLFASEQCSNTQMKKMKSLII